MAPKGKRAHSERLDVLRDPGSAISVIDDKSLRVDVMKLPAPERLYDADFAWVTKRNGAVSIFFAKGQPNSTTLRTRVELRYPLEAFVHQFWRNTGGDFRDRLRKFVDVMPRDEGRSDSKVEEWPAERDHSDWVSYEYIAHSGTHACLDFYQLNPTGIALFAKGLGTSRIELAPVIRIQMTAFELLRLLDESAPLAESLTASLPQEDDDGVPVR